MSYTDKTRSRTSRPPGPPGRRPVQAGAVHPFPPGRRHRGRVPRRRSVCARSSTCAPTTTSGCRATPTWSRPPMQGLDTAATACPRSGSSAGPRTSTASSSRSTTKFLGTEDTILFPSCMDANAGVFEAILTKDDVMISDRLVHASLIDGIRLCSAMQDTFKHSDMAHLEQKLQMHQDSRLRLVITDGVFSMDGDTAKLDEMVALCEKYDAMLLVDESHASGFIGKTGRGTHEKYGVMGKIDVITTTFGKALGGATGGCVSGRKELVEMCRQKARPYLFSNSIAPVVVDRRPQGLRDPQRLDRAPRQARAERRLLAQGPARRPASSSRKATRRSSRSCSSTPSWPRTSPGPSTTRASTPSASSSPSSPRARPASGPSSRPATRSTTSTRPSRPSSRSGKKFEILGKTHQEIIDRYGM